MRTIGDVGVFLVDKYAGVFVHRNKYGDVSPKEFALAILCAHTVPPPKATRWLLGHQVDFERRRIREFHIFFFFCVLYFC